MGFHVAESSKGLKFDTQTEGRTVDMPFGSNPGNPEAKVWPTWAHLSLRSLAGMPYADHGEVVFQAWDGDRFKGRGPGRPMLSDVFWCFFFFGGGEHQYDSSMFGCSKFKLKLSCFSIGNPKKNINGTHRNNNASCIEALFLLRSHPFILSTLPANSETPWVLPWLIWRIGARMLASWVGGTLPKSNIYNPWK